MADNGNDLAIQIEDGFIEFSDVVTAIIERLRLLETEQRATWEVKTTTGDSTTEINHHYVINTADGTIKVYADGSWYLLGGPWDVDQVIPDTPDTFTAVGVANGHQLEIGANDASLAAKGFTHWEVQQARDASGSDTVELGDFYLSNFPSTQIFASGTIRYYRIRAVDYAGRTSDWTDWDLAYAGQAQIKNLFDEYGGSDFSDLESLRWLSIATMELDETWATDFGVISQTTAYAIEGERSLSLEVDTGGQAVASLEFDFGKDLDQEGRFDEDDYVTLVVYIPSDTYSVLTNISVQFNTVDGNPWSLARWVYYWDAADLVAGWNHLAIQKQFFTATYGPVTSWAAIYHVQVALATSATNYEIYIDDIRLVKADVFTEFPNDLPNDWKYSSEDTDNETWDWHIYPGRRTDEPQKAFSFGQVNIEDTPELWYMAYKLVDTTQIYEGTVQAGIYMRRIDGAAGLSFYVQNGHSQDWTMYAVEADSAANTITLVYYDDGVRSVISSASFTFSPDQILWLGADFRDYDNESGRIRIYASLIEGNVIQAKNLIISTQDTSLVDNLGGSVGMLSYQANCRFINFTAGSPSHAEVADVSKALDGPNMFEETGRAWFRVNPDNNELEFSTDGGLTWRTVLSYGVPGAYWVRENDVLYTVDDTDEVAIGQSTANAKLDVKGEIASADLNGYEAQFRAVSGNYGFMIRNDGTNTRFLLTWSGDQYGSWSSARPFSVANATGVVTISNGLYLDDDLIMSGSVANIRLGDNWLSRDGSDSGIYVDATHQIGIRTSTPEAALEVVGPSDARIYISEHYNVTVGAWLHLRKSRGSDASPASVNVNDYAGGVMWNAYTNAWKDAASISAKITAIATNEVDSEVGIDVSDAGVLGRMVTINKTGMGIGTNAPALKVGTSTGFVEIEAATAPALLLHETTADHQWGIYVDSNSHLEIYEAEGAGENRVTIADGGFVGIGETSPAGNLHVKNTDTTGTPNAAAAHLVVESVTNCGLSLLTDNSGTSRIFFGDVANSDVGRIQYAHASDYMDIYTNRALAGRIDGSQQWGIGGVSPAVQLDIAGTATSGRSLQVRSGDAATGTDSAQIILSYNNASYDANGYAHSIRTRHNASSQNNNAIDFWLWNQSVDTASTLGSMRVMTLEGEGGSGRVGIATASPDEALHVVGSIKMVDGNEGVGKVLTSDANGVGSWQAIIEGSKAACGGRLTLQSGVSVSTSNQASKSTLYFTSHPDSPNAGEIGLYDGSTTWNLRSFSEISLALSGLTSGKNYDVFVYDSGGTPTLELSAAWTNDTTRADAITTQDGIYVKSGATTRRYVGTIRATGATTTTDTESQRFVWNLHNRTRRTLEKEDSSGHSYTTASWRQWGGNSANKVEMVSGVDYLLADVAMGFTCNAGANGTWAIGSFSVDSTTARKLLYMFTGTSRTESDFEAISASVPVGLGYHYIAALQYVSTGSGGSFDDMGLYVDFEM